MKISTITFDESAFPDIRKMLGLKNLKCHHCGKRITKKNIGGIFKDKKIICRDTICLIQQLKESVN